MNNNCPRRQSKYAKCIRESSGKWGTFVLHAEYKLWREHWLTAKKGNSAITQTVLDTMYNCNKDKFPEIHKPLLFLTSLPISVAMTERSFSSLRRLKTWLRNRTEEERLNGLALLHIHRDTEVNIDSISNRFMRKEDRRVDFIL
ncbi:hypothetical protein PR048_023484 [Dryococelus australis]|uniref:HAT C-terminal dimerisation domain-containing protein n=1 Tax=Dryococelus australis TaxID=614101 RepID=A0ABQ9GUA3_9NEOP|nr:hypothetical protein PR048_023484 [Dryococelus australis]